MAYYEANKARWNELVEIHAKSEEYDLEGFMVGMNSLHQAELEIPRRRRGEEPPPPPVPLRAGHHRLGPPRGEGDGGGLQRDRHRARH